jgi:hypothetical protein
VSDKAVEVAAATGGVAAKDSAKADEMWTSYRQQRHSVIGWGLGIGVQHRSNNARYQDGHGT